MTMAKRGQAEIEEPPPMEEAEMACRIGDLLTVVAPLELTGTIEKYSASTVKASGQVYKVAGLFGRGWDLELVSGTGPKEIRVLNGYVKKYFRHSKAAAAE